MNAWSGMGFASAMLELSGKKLIAMGGRAGDHANSRMRNQSTNMTPAGQMDDAAGTDELWLRCALDGGLLALPEDMQLPVSMPTVALLDLGDAVAFLDQTRDNADMGAARARFEAVDNVLMACLAAKGEFDEVEPTAPVTFCGENGEAGPMTLSGLLQAMIYHRFWHCGKGDGIIDALTAGGTPWRTPASPDSPFEQAC